MGSLIRQARISNLAIDHPQATPGDCVIMKWETPKAIDVRFGFEITMYFANR